MAMDSTSAAAHDYGQVVALIRTIGLLQQHGEFTAAVLVLDNLVETRKGFGADEPETINMREWRIKLIAKEVS
jgi:hypothetical protein